MLSPRGSAVSSGASPPLTPSLRRQKIVSIELTNDGRGFGFGVISDPEGGRGTLVHSIVKGSSADKVGSGGLPDSQIHESQVPKCVPSWLKISESCFFFGYFGH